MKITLIGSTRFHERFQELNEKLSAQGHLVYSVAFAKIPGTRQPSPAEKTTLDLVHLRKILESDAIVIIGCQEDGTYYIGESTKRELEWALINEKSVYVEKAWSMPDGRVTSVEESYNMKPNLVTFLEGLAEACKPPPAPDALLQKGGNA